MSIIASERPVITSRPKAGSKLPDVHAELLALISAHIDAGHVSLSWPSLLRYVDAVAFDGPDDLVLDDSLRNRNPDRFVAELLGDLIDYDLIAAEPRGLELTQAGLAALKESDDRGLADTMAKWVARGAGRVSPQ